MLSWRTARNRSERSGAPDIFWASFCGFGMKCRSTEHSKKDCKNNNLRQFVEIVILYEFLPECVILFRWGFGIAFYGRIEDNVSMLRLFKRQSDQKESCQEPCSSFGRLRQSLKKTRQVLGNKLTALFSRKSILDLAWLNEIEETLIQADVGISAAHVFLDALKKQISLKKIQNSQAAMEFLKQEMVSLLRSVEKPGLFSTGQKPFMILMVGVNGTGKTTTIGKLAKRFQNEGFRVMLAAGDTFRAAAIDQLKIWGARNEVPVVAQQPGADSASVIYDAVISAKAKDYDILMADTAGRLHTQNNLMDELKKVVRVIQKIDNAAPHEIWLVLDACIGQNALVQAQQFHEAVGVTGIVMTKLDGTAKGGIVFSIANQLHLPIRFIGVGEQAEDLQPFHAQEFVDALMEVQGYDSI